MGRHLAHSRNQNNWTKSSAWFLTLSIDFLTSHKVVMKQLMMIAYPEAAKQFPVHIKSPSFLLLSLANMLRIIQALSQTCLFVVISRVPCDCSKLIMDKTCLRRVAFLKIFLIVSVALFGLTIYYVGWGATNFHKWHFLQTSALPMGFLPWFSPAQTDSKIIVWW